MLYPIKQCKTLYYIFFFISLSNFSLFVNAEVSDGLVTDMLSGRGRDIVSLDYAVGKNELFGYYSIRNNAELPLTIFYNNLVSSIDSSDTPYGKIQIPANVTKTFVLNVVNGSTTLPNIAYTLANKVQRTEQNLPVKLLYPFDKSVPTTIGGYQAKEDHYHMVDINTEEGTPIKTAAAGTVAYVKNDSDEWCYQKRNCQDSGNQIIVVTDNGLSMLYLHLQKGSIYVKEGQRVKQGDVIGLVGCTGYCLTPHLHFEVRAIVKHNKNSQSIGEDNESIANLPFSFFNCGSNYKNLSPNLICHPNQGEAKAIISP